MFLVLEIVNDKGETEWKVAPKRWVCTSKNTQRPVLFWPDEFSVERQNQLAIEGTFKPLRSWGRKECVIKQEFATYDAAHSELQTLLALQSNQIKEEPEDPLKIERPESPEPPSPAQSTPDECVPMLASIKSMLETLIAKNARIEKQNADVVQQNDHIESKIFNLQMLVETVESKFTARVVGPDDSCNKPEETIYELNSEEKLSFQPMKTVWQLLELEKKLNDDSFNVKLVQLLLANVCGDNTMLRIESCVDLLCSPELQSKLNWISMIKLQNFLNLLKEAGGTSSERVTFNLLADFFNKHLYNLNRRRARAEQNAAKQNNLERKLATSSGKSRSLKKCHFQAKCETVEQLWELEMKLNDESFNAKLLQWLLRNVSDDNTVWRIKSCLDLLCSLELQSKLRWSRRNGSIMKEPIDELPNFVKLFIVVGKTPSEDVSYKGLAKCFMNHLKNSRKRFLMSLNRQRTSTWRRTKTKEISKNDVASEQVDSSIATNENPKDSDEIKSH